MLRCAAVERQGRPGDMYDRTLLTLTWHDARHDRPRRTDRRDLRLGRFLGPLGTAARGDHPHLRRADVRRRRDDRAPGPVGVGVLRHRRRRGPGVTRLTPTPAAVM